MTRTIAFILGVTVWCACAVARAQSERSVWDGVYTQEQSVRGQATFNASCATCHAPADFTGASFLMNWEASTAWDLFTQVLKTMPMDNPGSLRPEDYADVITYFFRLNAMPTGKDELDTDAAHLKSIRITQKK
jgi:polar amino acid transport system substrate-binding protein